MSEYDPNGYKFSRPAEHIKALNVGPIPQRIFDDMSKYNDTARGMPIIPSPLAEKWTQAHVLYVITNTFGDFASIVAYDTLARTAIHITTPEPPHPLHPLRAIPWETGGLLVTPVALFLRANVEGWRSMYTMPLSGGTGADAQARARKVFEVRMGGNWEGSPVAYATNVRNGGPNELVVQFDSFRMNEFLASIDFSSVFEGALPQHRTAPPPPPQRTRSPCARQHRSPCLSH